MVTTMSGRWIRAAAVAAMVVALAGCQTVSNMMGKSDSGHTQRVALTGANEVPPVNTGAAGEATVTVNPDGSVTVKLTTSGMTPTAAHIHEAAAGANGPVIVPLTKQGDNTFVSASGARLTDAQLQSYKAGRTYLNVHSAKNPGGEIRGQLKGQ